ncbi:MAG TPA: isoaspartyl peptidase/L-asparaginase [Cryomorphaceae bacterium]|nr:isoaspartyl peptidase/L-asparaginase [Cryomorphaceae bacterium]
MTLFGTKSPLVFVFTFWICLSAIAQNKPILVIHGGAGTIERGMLSDSLELEIKSALQKALDTGYGIMSDGGTAVDAVEATLMVLEDSPHFNAGKGSVMTKKGNHELDASIMDGKDLNAGAVTGVSKVKNPISAARGVMDKSPHVMFAGRGADEFAKTLKLELVPNAYFTTPRIRKNWKHSQIKEGRIAPAEKKFSKFGTVGCVALDGDGNIAAGTSTGGMMNKANSRIGDSPIIGAGTYADNNTCGVSSTGHGEYFIRIGVAKEISDQMEFGNKTLKEAVNHTIHNKLSNMDALGGVIALDRDGNIEMVFNTPGMYRGYKTDSENKVLIYGKDD